MTFRPLLAILLCSILAACVSETPLQTHDPMSQASAIAVSTPEFVMSADTTLHWHSNLIWVDDPEGRYERHADMLQNALQNEFERKGYSFVATREAATYDVLAVALLGAIEGHEELTQVFRMYPSLSSASQGYKRGTILVAIAPAGTKTIVWRGALEIFTDPGMQPVQVREQRMQWGAQQVLGSIPNYQ